jgi:hypothetical protein
MEASHLSHVGVNPFTQNDTPWFVMCVGGKLLNSYVNSTGHWQKPRDGVRLGHFASDRSYYLRFCVVQIDPRR